MSQAALKPVTVTEFLRWEDGTDRRYELIHGKIVAMARAARAHGVLAARMISVLAARLKPPCLPESEAGILLPNSDKDFYIADVAVSCSPVGRERWCPDPLLIVEVLSPSTEDDNRASKVPPYRKIPSLQDILVIASQRVAVEHYARNGDLWVLGDLGPGDVIRLAGLDVTIPVDELYAGIGFDETAA
jgi:Uma2 family endonuclease